MVWDGDVMQYQSFKKQMLELLDYDNPSLDLETKANEALKCLLNVRVLCVGCKVR